MIAELMNLYYRCQAIVNSCAIKRKMIDVRAACFFVTVQHRCMNLATLNRYDFF
jgi:hypothetical protein